MSDELKLCGCPFGCPKPVTLSDYTDKPRGAWLLAHRCDVVGPLFVEGYSGEQLAAAWNQRAKPVVKALEFFKWKRAGGGYHEGHLLANTQAGNYAIMHHESKGLYYLACPDSTEYYDTLDKAAAAAQVDFTRRVHACLEGYDD